MGTQEAETSLALLVGFVVKGLGFKPRPAELDRVSTSSATEDMLTSECIDSHTHLQRAETSMRNRHTDTDTEDTHMHRQSHT